MDSKKIKLFLAYLRSIYIVHQNAHWTCKGSSFYSNHLLFERIYESAKDNADAVAEKIIGLFGNDLIDLAEQNEFIHNILKDYDGTCYENSLKIESDFQELAKQLYEELNDSDMMTLGLDDLIMSICNEREEAIYLLKQSM